MFLAVIIPPARKSRVLAGVITVSMAMSFAFSRIAVFQKISSGMQIILLTVLIAGAAAILFPIEEDDPQQQAVPVGKEARHAA